MPIIPNQGFRRDLNFGEPINDTNALNNLGGAGIANDLRIIQNNLRNKDVLTFTDASANYDAATGLFKFPDVDLIFTNDDVVTPATDILNSSNVGVITAGTTYFIVSSDGQTEFGLSERSSTDPLGVSTITGAIQPYASIEFVRSVPVTFENTKNFIEPDLLSGFRFVTNLNGTFDFIQANNDFAKFDITRKFKANADTTTIDPFKTEGSILIDDPGEFNQSEGNLNSLSSPGVFIGTTRAFSSDNNPWEKVGTALQTEGHFVSIADLVIDGLSNDSTDEVKTINASSNLKRNNIRINGVTVGSYADGGPDVGDLTGGFQFKLPIVVNGETYYMLLKS
jgi:hypothetical protein